ncbi:DUF1361 domain-containing protein [Algibacter sp. PT7-4]|uniref:DUF1361 domain-containing protein n=1 Tax=Algibacter ulvanivorans TaxID=3400999 RepID=UPI003AABCFB0
MNSLKQLFLNRNKTVWLLGISILYSLALLVIQIKISNSLFYLILIWNLFLAVLPYVVSCYLSILKNHNKIAFTFSFCLWIVLLPNAPYIITDFIHLKISNPYMLWLDALLISSFAFNGLLLFYLSVHDVKTLLYRFFTKRQVNYIIIVTMFLTSFGIYLGRFLRYNSWEILSNPKCLFIDIFNIITSPNTNQEAWLFTILFGLFLCIGNFTFKIFYSNPST